MGGILDSNPASDSDLWIAYSLSQAAILWDERRYSILAAVLAQRIMREETAYIPGLGLSLLPAPAGFEFDNERINLNPAIHRCLYISNLESYTHTHLGISYTKVQQINIRDKLQKASALIGLCTMRIKVFTLIKSSLMSAAIMQFESIYGRA